MANEFKVKKGLVVDGTGTVLDIQGTQGQLFSVTDSLTGDLFSVSDISGVPILNVNSSGAVNVDGTLTVGGSITTVGGNIIAGGAVYPASNASASLGLSNKQWAGLDLSSSSAITWGNGDAEIIEGETNNYSLTFKTYDGTNNSAALRLDGDNTATFTGNISTPGQVSIADTTTYARLNLSGAQANGISYSLYTAIPGVSNSGFTIRRTSGGDSNVLSLDGSNNATFAGNVTLNSRLTFDYGGDHYFEAGTNTLAYKSSSGTSIMLLNASTSAATFAGSITAGSSSKFQVLGSGYIQLGNCTISASGDNNHIHVTCPTALIPNSTTLANNTRLGTAAYRWKDFYSGPGNFEGSVTASADVIAYSDARLKENVKTLDGNKVLQMRGVSFDRKDTGISSSGVIAQEMQKVAPELVSDDDGTLGVAYGNLTGYLIEAIKEQQKQIDELKKIIKDGDNL